MLACCFIFIFETMADLSVFYDVNTPAPKFNVPGNMAIYGPSKSGKTHFLKKLLRDRHKLFAFDKEATAFKKIYYFYGSGYQEVFKEIKFQIGEEIVFREGFPAQELSEMIELENRPALVILDDLETEIQKSPSARMMLSRESHHSNLYVIMVFQALFDRGNSVRLREQFDSQVFMKYLSNKQGLRKRFNQFVPDNQALNLFVTVYDYWMTLNKGGYIVCDFHSRNRGLRMLERFRTWIFRDDPVQLVLLPKYEPLPSQHDDTATTPVASWSF